MRYPIVIVALLTGLPMMAQAELAEDDPITARSSSIHKAMRSNEFKNGAQEFTPTQLELQPAYDKWDTTHQPLWDVVPGRLKSQLSKDERMNIAVQARLDNDSRKGLTG